MVARADPWCATRALVTPLHLAAGAGCLPLIRSLLDAVKGQAEDEAWQAGSGVGEEMGPCDYLLAYLDWQDADGDTALHAGLLYGWTAECLIVHGSDPVRELVRGSTASPYPPHTLPTPSQHRIQSQLKHTRLSQHKLLHSSNATEAAAASRLAYDIAIAKLLD